MKVHAERIKGLTQEGLMTKLLKRANEIGAENIINITVTADANSMGRNKFGMIFYKK